MDEVFEVVISFSLKQWRLKDIYDVDRQQGDIDLTVDHRLLSDEGRKQIAVSRSHRSHGNSTKKQLIFACYLSKAKFQAVKKHSWVCFLIALALLKSDLLLFRQVNAAFGMNAAFPA